MTRSPVFVYAFSISLPAADDLRLRDWTAITPGASWDVSGGHVTIARFVGDLPLDEVARIMRESLQGIRPFEVAFTQVVRQPYWDKPGLEIVMLVGETLADIAGTIEVRERLLAALQPAGLQLSEGGAFLPHVTLTTGLPPQEATGLETAAVGLDLRFTPEEVAFWANEREGQEDAWVVADRLELGVSEA